MKNKITFIKFCIILTFSCSSIFAEEANSGSFMSAYTSIDEKDCLTLDSDNLGSIQECEAFRDIRVRVIEGDIRQSVTLTYKNKEYILNFQSVVNSDFSTLGFKIERRYEIGNPDNIKGLIVQLEVNNDPDDLDRVTSLLAVSKITENDICVIGKILPQEKQHELAREMLNSSTDEMPCLKDMEKH